MSVKATQFKGGWPDRLRNLFDHNLPLIGASVLDVGCNMGIVGYEVCKHGVTDYHGIDVLPDHLDVARGIFMGVPCRSRIEALHLPTALDRLDSAYDVILYLAVHQHIRKAQGAEKAAETARGLFRRTGTLVFRGPDVEALKAIALEEGFEIAHETPQGELFPLLVFQRW